LKKERERERLKDHFMEYDVINNKKYLKEYFEQKSNTTHRGFGARANRRKREGVVKCLYCWFQTNTKQVDSRISLYLSLSLLLLPPCIPPSLQHHHIDCHTASRVEDTRSPHGIEGFLRELHAEEAGGVGRECPEHDGTQPFEQRTESLIPHQLREDLPQSTCDKRKGR
jgi:hypothetical protein